MFFGIKFLFYFTLSFLILSFPLGDGQFFDVLSRYSLPFQQKFYNGISESLSESFNGKQIKKFFTNTLPSNDRSRSSRTKTSPAKNTSGEKITPEEMGLLEKVLDQESNH